MSVIEDPMQSVAPYADVDLARWLISVCTDTAERVIDDIVDGFRSTGHVPDEDLVGRLRQKAANDFRSTLVGLVAQQAKPKVALQPIQYIEAETVIGHEALARFANSDPRVTFAIADRQGRLAEVEILAIRAAFEQLPSIASHEFLSVNISAAGLGNGGFAAAIDSVPPERIVIEVNQQSPVEGTTLAGWVDQLRRRGVRVALDGAGVGAFRGASLHDLSPSIVKIDPSIVSGCDASEDSRQQIAKLVAIGRRIGAMVVACGVEHVAELDVVRGLGVEAAQGFLVGRPVLVDDPLSP